jgi:hypothetical protein
MSHGLNDLKNLEKMSKALRRPAELLNSGEELGTLGEQAVRVLVELQEKLVDLSIFPSLMGEEAWRRSFEIEKACSRAIALQTTDEYVVSKGRRKRLPKFCPTLVWSFHAGKAEVFVKTVQTPGETFGLARGCWEGDGYPGDQQYAEEQEAVNASIASYNGSLEVTIRNDRAEDLAESSESCPSLEELFEGPSTSAAAATISSASSTRTATTTKKTATVIKRKSKKTVAQGAKRNRRSSEFDVSDDTICEIIDNAESQKKKKTTRSNKRVKKQ